MRHYLILTIPIVMMLSCNSSIHSESKPEVVIVHDTIYQKDTVLVEMQSEIPDAKTDLKVEVRTLDKIGEQEKKPDKKVKPTVPTTKVDDNIHYYTDNGRVSVREFPWKDDRKKMEVYNRSGEITYEFEDVLLSYQTNTTFQFRTDGSLEIAKVRTNSGASMYWSESLISFSTNNEPLEKIDRTYPETQLELPKILKWDKTHKKWVMQKSISE